MVSGGGNGENGWKLQVLGVSGGHPVSTGQLCLSWLRGPGGAPDWESTTLASERIGIAKRSNTTNQFEMFNV